MYNSKNDPPPILSFFPVFAPRDPPLPPEESARRRETPKTVRKLEKIYRVARQDVEPFTLFRGFFGGQGGAT